MDPHNCRIPQAGCSAPRASVGSPRFYTPVVVLLALAALAGCSDRELPTASPVKGPNFSEDANNPVVNSLADPGDGTCDDAECTLREAIAVAPSWGASTITFDPSLTSSGAQVITLDPGSGQLTIPKSLTINGPGAGLLTVRRATDATANFRIFLIDYNWSGFGIRNVWVTITGLTISGGMTSEDGGGIANFQFDNSLALSRVIITGNTARNGGGVYNGGILTVDSSTISGNTAPRNGGGLMGGGTGGITIKNSTISGNGAGDRGGGIFQYVGNTSLTNVTFTGNSASIGGAFGKEAYSATFNHVTVAGNGAQAYGGIYSLTGGAAVVLANTIVANNGGGNCGSFGNPAIADGNGNLVYPSTAPCPGITPATSGDPKLGSLTVNAPGTTATMALGAGSAAVDKAVGDCPAQDQRGVSRPQGAACDIGAYEQEPSSDATPPVITPNVSGTLGDNGWYTSTVTVSWTVSDAESAVTSPACPSTTISADTPGETVSCSATSAGGKNSQEVTIRRDATSPAMTPNVSPSSVLLNGSATATPNASDAMSGVASASCSAINTATAGSKTVACTAKDNAGNVANASATYRVTYQFVGFAAPIDGGSALNVAKAGPTIPLKWRVLDASGAPVTTLTSATVTAVALACSAGSSIDQVEEYASGGSGLQNLGSGYYQFNWSTPKSYAGSCKTMSLNLGEGLVHTALFQFTK